MRILLADDDFTYSRILIRFLQNEGHTVSYAGNGNLAMKTYRAERPDLVLLDVNMPGRDGFEVAREIREHDKRTAIFFLTDRSDANSRLDAFRIMADDFIPKPFYPEELIARIRLRLPDMGDNKTIRLHDVCLDVESDTITIGEERHTITSRQAEIVSIFMRNVGKTISRQELLNQIWGDDTTNNSLALNVQISLIRQILAESRHISLTTIPRKGYRLDTDEQAKTEGPLDRKDY